MFIEKVLLLNIYCLFGINVWVWIEDGSSNGNVNVEVSKFRIVNLIDIIFFF